MALDPKILILEQSSHEATNLIEKGIRKARIGESKTKAINRISEEIFFKKLQQNATKQNLTTDDKDYFDDSISPHRSFPIIVLLLISLPISILISFNAGLREIPQIMIIIPCIFWLLVFSKTPYFLFAILSLSFLSYMAGSIIYEAINDLSLIHYFPSQ